MNRDFVARRQENQSACLDPVLKVIFAKMDDLRITHLELSQKVGVTAASISNWRTGRNSPNLYLLRCIAEYLDLDITAQPKGTDDVVELK